MRRYRAASLLALALVACMHPARSSRPQSQQFVLLYFGDITLDDLPRVAAEVAAARAGPLPVLALGGEFRTDPRVLAARGGAAELDLLNRTGLDGFLLGPELLALGTGLRAWADSCQPFCLATGWRDSAGRALTYEYLVKKLGFTHAAVVGFPAFTAPALPGLRRDSAVYALDRLVPLLRMRADFVIGAGSAGPDSARQERYVFWWCRQPIAARFTYPGDDHSLRPTAAVAPDTALARRLAEYRAGTGPAGEERRP